MRTGSSRTRAAVSLVGAAALASLLTECRDPTQISLELSTDAVCADLKGTSITVGRLGPLETKKPSTSTTQCSASGRIGELVVVPSGDDDEEVAFRIITGVKVPAADCAAPSYSGCIVARRALRYLPHTPLTVPIEMSLDCLDIPCEETQTCLNGKCVPAKIDPEDCTTPKGCQPSAGDGGDGDAGTDASDDQSLDVGTGGTAGAGGVAGGGGTLTTGGSGGAAGTDAGPDASDAGTDASDAGPNCAIGTAECDNNLTVPCEVNTTTDAANCGACGHDCLGGPCTASVCQPLALYTGASNLTILRILPDATHVYFTESVSTGAVKRVVKATGIVEDFALNQAYPRALALDSGELFWANADTGDVFRQPVTGGTPTLVTNVWAPLGLAVDGTTLYATSGAANSDVWAMPKGGSSVTPTSIALADWPYDIAAQAGIVFFNNFIPSNGTLWRYMGGSTIALHSGMQNPRGVAVDAGFVWHAEQGAGSKGAVYRIAGDGSGLTTLAQNQGKPVSLALDATHVYWANNADGAIMRTPRMASAVGFEALVTQANTPNAVATDGVAVYFSDGNQLFQVAKPLK